LESVAKSPIYSHFSQTLGGLSIIRAFARQENFVRDLVLFLDRYHRAALQMRECDRWLSLRLENIGNAILLFNALLLVYLKGDVSAALAGFVLNAILGLSGSLNWCVRTVAEMEAYMSSVERIIEYSTSVPQEISFFKETKGMHGGRGNMDDDNFDDLCCGLNEEQMEDVVSKLPKDEQDLETAEPLPRGILGRSIPSVNIRRALWNDKIEERVYELERPNAEIGFSELKQRRKQFKDFQKIQDYFGSDERDYDDDEHNEEGGSSGRDIETGKAKAWPPHGAITFSNVWLRYRKDLDAFALKGLDVSIRAGERVGVCGRTGSGKSSTLVCLLRLVEIYEGTISIDDVDIRSVPLSLLRSKVAIIPQESVLYSGTVRFNLDPFSQFSDVEIENSLRKVGLHEVVMNREGGLDSLVSEYGDNFSQGQRQLLSLCRALLRNCKILLLDEATSAIDYLTESKIQDILDTEFEGTTILTIAHRLTTLLSSDSIMFMSDGKVEEYGPLEEMLQYNPTNPRHSNYTGGFYELARQAGLTYDLYLEYQDEKKNKKKKSQKKKSNSKRVVSSSALSICKQEEKEALL
jgi:ABC-type multidrug transport system fused ATPase/permease subunit